uniref:AMSH-like ubiquitin thioesterase 2 n=1 Tax=Erigeron canadensis TaxID=72917 RepID=UPI001CB92696|nr:AMSH-like ubiquitin thioesterase 2 [Erigeron canadensis]
MTSVEGFSHDVQLFLDIIVRQATWVAGYKAQVYREEKNVIDLYVMLLRYSSLVLETIRFHRDYPALSSKERTAFKKQLRVVIEELESLKPEVDRSADDSNKCHARTDECQTNGHGGTTHKSVDSSFQLPPVNNSLSFVPDDKPLHQSESALSWNPNQGSTPYKQSGSVNIQLQKQWPCPAEEECDENYFLSGNIRQPSPRPVLAQLQPKLSCIFPSRVADPRPGPANSSQADSRTYRHLHIPVKIMEDFLRLAQQNTKQNLETCGILAGSLKNRTFQITTLIIPKQESTSHTCQTLNEEDIFEVHDKRSLYTLGWIHTHPSQTCFLSSVDLHTHYSYQSMLPEAIAIVMAPTDESRQHGIFHLSDPAGLSLIRNCNQSGFHPHEKQEDSRPIYEECSHVYMNEMMNFDVVDLR